MHSNHEALPFFPVSIEHAKRKAKQLLRQFPSIDSLQKSQEVTARAMGLANWHVLDRALKSGRPKTVFDEDLPVKHLPARTGCQMSALRAIPGATLLQIARFLPVWRLTAAPMSEPSSSKDEPELRSGTIRELAANYKWPTFVAGEFAVAPSDITFPVTRNDIETGHLRKFAQMLHNFPAYRKCPVDTLYLHLVRAFGYPDETSMIEASNNCRVDEAFLPDQLFELANLLCWRLYELGAGPLGSGREAVARTLQLCHMDVSMAIPLVGSGNVRDSDHWSRLNVPGLKVEDCEAEFGDTRCALRKDGLLLSRPYISDAKSMVEELWSPACGKSAVEVKADIAQDAIVPLEEYLEMRGLNCCPAGIQPITYIQRNNTIVGFSFRCGPANLYLNAVYPPDGKALLKALECLWRKTPVPPGIAPNFLPKTMLATPFYENSDLGLENIVPQRWPSATSRPAVQDLEAWERVPVNVGNEGLDMAVTVQLMGNMWKRSIPQFNISEIQGLLGFALSPSPSATTWLPQLVPLALDNQTCTDIHRVLSTCPDYLAKEWSYLKTEAGQQEYVEIVVSLSRSPLFKQEHRRDEWVCLSSSVGPFMLAERWPKLLEVAPKQLEATAAWHWGKHDVGDVFGNSGLLFLARALAAGLGITGGRVNFQNKAAILFSVIHLYRRSRQKILGNGTSGYIIGISDEALRLYTLLEEIENFVDRTDTDELAPFLTVLEDKGGEFINLGG